MWIVIHRSCKSVQSFQMGVISHVQSDWKQQVSYKSKNELRYEFDFCMWLGTHKYSYMIQSIYMSVFKHALAC